MHTARGKGGEADVQSTTVEWVGKRRTSRPGLRSGGSRGFVVVKRGGEGGLASERDGRRMGRRMGMGYG